MKEYAYLCDFPAKQGDVVLANNNQEVVVQRTADRDPTAFRYVKPKPSQRLVAIEERQKVIMARLNEITKELTRTQHYAELAQKSPEAKKLVREYHRNAAEIASHRSL